MDGARDPARRSSAVADGSGAPVPHGAPLAPELFDWLLDRLAARVAEGVAERLGDALAAGPPPPAYLDVDAAARYLSAPRSRVYDLVAQRRVQHCKDGRRLLFRAEWLDAALEQAP